jgi:hypothetical protein
MLKKSGALRGTRANVFVLHYSETEQIAEGNSCIGGKARPCTLSEA